ncbi:MAG: glycine--tRNA ligase subunit beta [Legionella sp.]|nr:glycine--tRNA ligase subunit beta [Legionella sp.]
MVNDFIFELGCEELPSGAVWPLADEFAKQLLALLDKAQLSYGDVRRFATPRRFAITIRDLQTEQNSQTTIRKGPAVIAAFDNEGNPTPALSGFAKSCGVTVEELTRMDTEKGEWMVFESVSAGSKTRDLIPALVTQALAALPIAKPMRWGNGDAEFARPVHWAVMLFGDEILEYDLLGIKTGRKSRGHRFHYSQEVIIDSAQSYEVQMQESYVIADFAKRREIIKDQISKLAEPYHALVIMPQALLDEVTSIVEWPQALMANFESQFLEVPAEALIASMQSHQKCFALTDTKGNLLPHFITVANIESSNPEQVVLGNEKVMRARLSDAAFFFRQDKKNPLSSYVAATNQVVFQIKLGTLHDKAMRIKALMRPLSHILGCLSQHAERAAELSKCDLLTGMVGEFPELQGLMGYYYALHDGEDERVARALNEQYMPRFAADDLPESSLGMALSLADRLDTLVGIFAIGQKPSGVKDPFKLRRHALAVVRMLCTTPAKLNLTELIAQTAENYGSPVTLDNEVLRELKIFILDRMNAFYQAQDVGTDLLMAVRARQDDWLYDLDKRLNALKLFVTMPEAASLSAACKRVSNLLSHSKTSDVITPINEQLIAEGAEQVLYEQIINLDNSLEPLYREGNYGVILKQLAGIREPVDMFFDKVMVMVDDEEVKNNRLNLLARLQKVLQGVADISMLQIP